MAGRDYGALLKALEEEVKEQPTITPPEPEPEVDQPWYKDVYDFVSQPFTGEPDTSRLEAEGIRTEGAPLGVRAKAGMPTDPASRSIAAMTALGDQAQFKLDKQSQRLLYKMPGEESWNTIDPPGLDFGDIAEVVGDIPAMTGETLGYLLQKRIPGGGRVWNIIKKTLGIGGGAAGGEAAREQINVETGAYEHLTPEQVEQKFTTEPMKAGGMALGGAAAARTLGGLYKTVSNYAKGISMPERFRRLGLDLPEVTPEAVTEINRFLSENNIPLEFKPDTARLMNDPQFMAALDLYAKNAGLEGHRVVRELYEANRNALEAALTASESKLDLPGGVTGYEVGETIQRIAERGTSEAEQQVEQRVARTASEADAAQAALQSEARTTTDEAFGEQLRNVAELENAALKDWADSAYGSLAKKAGTMRFYHNNLQAEAQRQSNLFETDISKQLTAENRTLVSDILENLRTIRETPTGGLYEAPRTSSFEQQQRLISQLKRAEREIDKGTLTGIEKSSLTQLRLAAMRDRTERLVQFDNQNNTRLSQELADIEKEYAIRKDKAARGTMGRLIEYVNGRPKIASARVFDSIFGTDRMRSDSTREFLDVVTSDTKYMPELQELRRGVFDSFIRQNMTTKGDFNPDRARKWIEDRRANLSSILTPDQMTMLENARTKADALTAIQKSQKEFQTRLNKSIPGRVANMSPSEVFKNLWKSPETVEEARRLLQQDYPQEWNQFRSSALSTIRGQIMKYDPLVERKAVDFNSLNKLLDDEQTVRKMDALFGPEYTKNLTLIRNAAEILGRNPGSVPIAEGNPWFDVLRKVVFGPLDHRSFAIRTLSKFRHSVQLDNLGQLMLDPSALHQAAKAATTPQGAKDLQILIGGSTAIGSSDSSPDTSFTSEPLVQELQGVIKNNPNLREKVRRAISQ